MKKLILIIALFATSVLADTDSLTKSIYFQRGATSLSSQQAKIVETHAEFIKQTPDISLILEAHTDKAGKPKNHKWIAYDYAKATKEKLVSLGVDASKISIIIKGSEKSEGANSRDRRVDFIYYY